MIKFEFDSEKANANLEKHGVRFEEAKSVFYDFAALIFDDEKHSQNEKREIVVGVSHLNRLLMTCFTERNSKIRIISSRLANKIERAEYEKNKKEH